MRKSLMVLLALAILLVPAVNAQALVHSKLSSQQLLEMTDYTKYDFSTDVVESIVTGASKPILRTSLSDGIPISYDYNSNKAYYNVTDADAQQTAAVLKYLEAYKTYKSANPQSQQLTQAKPEAAPAKIQAPAPSHTPTIQTLIDYAKANADTRVQDRFGKDRYYALTRNNFAIWYLGSKTGSDHLAIARFFSVLNPATKKYEDFTEIYFDWKADGNLDAYVRFPFDGKTFDVSRIDGFYQSFSTIKSLLGFRCMYSFLSENDNCNQYQAKDKNLNTVKDEVVVLIARPDSGEQQMQIFDFGNKKFGDPKGADDVSSWGTSYLKETEKDKNYIKSLKTVQPAPKKTASIFDGFNSLTASLTENLKAFFGIA